MKLIFQISQKEVFAELEKQENQFFLKLLNQHFSGKILDWSPPCFSIQTQDRIVKGVFFCSQQYVDVHLAEGNFRLRYLSGKTQERDLHSLEEMISPMPGKVVKVLVNEGDAVKKGDLLMILEAMKMEHKIIAPQDGIVKKIFFKEGERVAQEVELLKLSSL